MANYLKHSDRVSSLCNEQLGRTIGLWAVILFGSRNNRLSFERTPAGLSWQLDSLDDFPSSPPHPPGFLSLGPPTVRCMIPEFGSVGLLWPKSSCEMVPLWLIRIPGDWAVGSTFLLSQPGQATYCVIIWMVTIALNVFCLLVSGRFFQPCHLWDSLVTLCCLGGLFPAGIFPPLAHMLANIWNSMGVDWVISMENHNELWSPCQLRVCAIISCWQLGNPAAKLRSSSGTSAHLQSQTVPLRSLALRH